MTFPQKRLLVAVVARRTIDVAHTTLQRQTERLGRHCLLLHEALRPRGAPREPLVLDGFRTFENGQYWPFDLNLLIGLSHFVYGFNDAELRRSGTMTPAQRRKRTQLERRHGRPDPQATRSAVEELVARIVPSGGVAAMPSLMLDTAVTSGHEYSMLGSSVQW